MWTRRVFLQGICVLGLSAVLPAAAMPVDESWDIIVVGAGGAGLSAAVTVAEAGYKVLLLEKMPSIGGNTLRASGLFNAADPQRQVPQGIKDSADWHYRQMLASGGGANTPEVVRRFCDEALPTLHWLESWGLRFLPKTVATWGAEWPRGHKPILPRGQGYIRTLSEAFLKKGGVIRVNTRVTDLIVEKSTQRTVGVFAEEKTKTGNVLIHRIGARYGVILTAGGFASNPVLVAKYAPQYKGYPTDNSPGTTGDMLLAAHRAGAALTGMQYVQSVPGSPQGRSFQVRLDLDAARFILVDAQGKRFVDEDTQRDILSEAILSQPGSVYTITDRAGLESYDLVSQKDIYRGLQTGDAIRADSIEELARRIGVPAETLKETVRAYNAQTSETKNIVNDMDKCSRLSCQPIKEAPFWASKIVLNVHSTMGGLKITPRAQVLNEKAKVMPALWAAGEVTGNVHGVNRIGGNGIADAITYGRIAGKSAVEWAKKTH